jgi:Ni,Fe-hydrogenase III large subunit/Ni,Fe-hydrogenase III component G
MPVRRWFDASTVCAGAPGVHALEVTRETWRQAAGAIAAAGGRLLALWTSRSAGGGARAHAALSAEPGVLVMALPLAPVDTDYPGLEDLFPAASRMQRAAADLTGVRSTDPDARPWLKHAAWPEGYRPLVDGEATPDRKADRVDAYAFVRVEGDGVHEIPVGPVHAGIIEPGHFRFSIVGEKVLRLEERLGYVHKGIERRFTELPILEGHRLAARVSGDSAVAFSWAYCQGLEGMAGVEIPPRAAWLRAVCLELERIANHLGDLGALGNDAGFAFGLAQFSRLKEGVLRATEQALGQRYLLDAVVPGGVRAEVTSAGAHELARHLQGVVHEAVILRDIYDEHAGVRDRFVGAGTVTPALAARLGLTGLAGRASGQAFDLRIDLPCSPYVAVAPAKCGRSDGDVAARVAVRFDELLEACKLVQRLLAELPAGAHRVEVAAPGEGAFGIGLIEGWRGPVLVALESGAAGSIRRCHPHDPSWQNWPVLEHAIIGNIVPDFPLINKSFNLSYSGHDL